MADNDIFALLGRLNAHLMAVMLHNTLLSQLGPWFSR